MSFALHELLKRDALEIGDFPLSKLLLMNNAAFPWLVLVPMRSNVSELFDLEPADYEQVMQEVKLITKQFAEFTGADKMNVAALGNIVPQLHIHIIARFTDDAAWPRPIWDSGVEPVPYSPEDAQKNLEEIKQLFAL